MSASAALISGRATWTMLNGRVDAVRVYGAASYVVIVASAVLTVFTLTRTFSDAVSLSDSGSIAGITYAIDYFAEDYVGYARSF